MQNPTSDPHHPEVILIDDELVLITSPEPPRERPWRANPPPRRWSWPLSLFALTCLTTFWAGACRGSGDSFVLLFAGWRGMREILELGAVDGFVYMTTVMSILLAHELGHFLQALRYHIPASLPMFIPMPFTPLGTMGAVIAMRGSSADRRQLFDIGLTGPWAGLLVALPIAWHGVATAVPVVAVGIEPLVYQRPLLLQLLVSYLHPDLPSDVVFQFNPYLQAAWVGLLVTGLNMMPISQLDGGHVSYALLGRRAHRLALALLLVALFYILVSGEWGLIVMLMLLMFLGPYHPPTANDHVPLGPWRTTIGWLSLALPLVCFTPVPIRVLE